MLENDELRDILSLDKLMKVFLESLSKKSCPYSLVQEQCVQCPKDSLQLTYLSGTGMRLPHSGIQEESASWRWGVCSNVWYGVCMVEE